MSLTLSDLATACTQGVGMNACTQYIVLFSGVSSMQKVGGGHVEANEKVGDQDLRRI